ncbi:MAG: hypothetical protein RH860_05325 [Cytophagales bacterium]
MNATLIHLALNHLPILGTLTGIIILAFALWKTNSSLINAALIILIISGISAIPVSKSGEEAEHVVEEYPGVSHDQIHEHEELAESAMPVSLVMGVLAAVALYFQVKSHPRARIASISVLVLAICNFALMANVAHEGGKIRRPDLRQEHQQIDQEGDQNDEH